MVVAMVLARVVRILPLQDMLWQILRWIGVSKPESIGIVANREVARRSKAKMHGLRDYWDPRPLWDVTGSSLLRICLLIEIRRGRSDCDWLR